jgi:hypothetical protein
VRKCLREIGLRASHIDLGSTRNVARCVVERAVNSMVELDSSLSCNNDSGRGFEPSQQQITEDNRFRDEPIPVMERS